MIHEAHDRRKPTKAELALAEATEAQYAQERLRERTNLLRAILTIGVVGVALWLVLGTMLKPEPVYPVDNSAPLPQTNPVCVYLEDHSMAGLLAMQVDAGADARIALTRNTQEAQTYCPEYLDH